MCCVSKIYAAPFTDNLTDNKGAGVTTFSSTLEGIQFNYSIAGGDGGDFFWTNNNGVGNSPAVNAASGAQNLGTTETITIARNDSADFTFTGIWVDNLSGDETVTVAGYLDNVLVGSAQDVVSGATSTLSFSNLVVDEVRVYSIDIAFLYFDDFSGDTTVADTTAPTFENSTPTATGANYNGATVEADIDEEGTIYYVVVADSASAPSSAQVKAGLDSSDGAALVSGNFVTSSTTGSETFTGLSAGTAYDLYVVAEDDEGSPNLQSSPALVNFTTSTANALYFDTDAKVTGFTAISPAAFTVEFRLFLDSVTTDWQGIYWSDDGADIGIYLEDDDSVSLWTATTLSFKSDTALTFGAWNHVAMTYSVGDGLRMYINGTESTYTEPGGDADPAFLPSNNLTMGYGPGQFGDYGLGSSALDDFRIWNVVRTAQEISDNKDAELSPPYSANLVRYYDFNHGTGGANNAGVTTLVERTGNGANATLSGFDLSGDVSNWVESTSLASQDSDSTLTAGGGSEATTLSSLVDTSGEAVNLLDFTITDLGTSDGLATTISQVVVNVSGTSSTTDRAKITWLLNGTDATDVSGTYNAGANTVTFTGLSISVADSTNETYTVSGYLGTNTGLADNTTVILSVNGSSDLTIGGAGSQMASGQSAVTSGAGAAFTINATQLAFTTQPAGSTSGSTLSTQPVVAARDAFGNTDVDFTETVTLTEASAGSLTGASVAAVSGVATFTAVNYTATADQQSFTLTANDQDGVGTDLSTANSSSVTSDVVATQLQFSTQPAPTSVSSGVATPFTSVPVVQAVDANTVVDTGYSTNIVLSVTDPNDSTVDGTVNSMSATVDLDGDGTTVTLTPSSGAATYSGLQLQYTAGGLTDTIALRATSGGLTGVNSTDISAGTPPTVTDGNISISGASGTGGAYITGDTITATWDNTGSGDANSGVSAVTVDFSAFGGGAAVVASNSSGTWTASYTITAGAIDSTNLNVSVAVTSTGGSATTADTTNATVDNIAPTVTDGNISLSGASGSGGAYKVGDTVTATWNNTGAGDNNSDTISAVTVNFSAFGGGTAVSASNSSGTWTATYTIVAGAVDGTNLNVSVTATDNAGNATTTVDSTNASVDNSAPTITDGNISISGASGIGSTYIVGDTVTATWNNTGAGDNNSDTISSVTADFSAFGGGATVAASNSSDTWTATYTIVAGAVDGTNLNVSMTATDNAGNTNTTADTTNATVDNNAPTVTDGNISISGASGSGGAFKVGDTVTATWDNTAGGDNNSDTISSVTVDFSAFGGGAAVSASNSSGTWTAAYTLTAGAVDGSNLNVAVTATDNAGNATTTADSTNATVDSSAPTLIDANISISGASGTGGAYIVGDTITVSWDNTGSGDNNTDTISAVTVDFSAFGGGASVAASNSSDTWTATYTLTEGSVDGTNLNVSATATDNAGNTTSTADTTNATVDNVSPTVTDANISISGASGSGGAFKVGDTVTATWINTAGGDNNSDTISSVTVDFSAFGGGAAVTASNSSGTWTAAYTLTAGAVDGSNLNVSVSATDNAGNITTTADTTNATVDSSAPTLTDGNISISGASGTGGAYKVGDTLTVTWNDTGSGDNNTDTISTVTVDFSAFGGGAAVAASNSSDTWTATYTLVAGAIDTTNLNVSLTATDDAGNATTTADTSNATVDNIAPTVTDGNIGLSGATGTGGVFQSGDTVTVTWTNTAGGDNNGDISSVAVDFSAFGGGAAVAASNAADVWTATYALADDVDASNLNAQVSAVDDAGNITQVADSSNATVDTTAPAGHSVSFDDTSYNNAEASSISFTMASAEVGAAYSYTISSSGGGTPVTGSGTVATASDQITGLNVAGLSDGTLTLSLTLTDTIGNSATAVTDTATLDASTPSGHSVSFDDGNIGSAEAAGTSFTVSSAEVGAGYDYTISSDGGGTPVTGSGTFASATEVIGSVDVSSLSDGTLTVSVTVTDTAGNAASAVTDTSALDQTLPSVSLTTASTTVNAAFSATIAFSETMTGFTLADLGITNASLSAFSDDGGGNFSVTVTPSSDGTVTLSLAADAATDGAGNGNTAATDLVVTYDGTAPTLGSSSPLDGATDVAYDANLQLTFSENIAAGSGNIVLYNAADDSVFESVAIGGSAVTISGSGVTVDWSGTLVPTSAYYVQIDSTAIVDSANNVYAGINDTTSLNFTVANSNPVANDDSATVAEDNAVAITVLTNDTDVDSALNAASVTVVTGAADGSTSVNTGTGVITYTPDADFNGTDTFTYTVEDVYSGVSNTATVTVTVTAVNDAPEANADTATTTEDNFVSIDVAANDSDIDTGDSVDTSTIVIVASPSDGSASVVNGEVLYTPDTNFNGSDSFTYTIEDQNGQVSNVATVMINITGVNDLPSAGVDGATVDEDGSVDIDVLANDSDIDGTIDSTSVTEFSAPSDGSLAIDAITGVITYTPNADFNGSDAFSYSVLDDSGGMAIGVVNVTVNSINDDPVANADTASLLEDTPHTINVLGNDTDVDGTLNATTVEVVTDASDGTTAVNATTGSIVYTPGTNFNGSDSFTYRVQDDLGAWSAAATVTLTIQAVNDDPLANNDSATVDEDASVVIDLLANDSDVDGTLDANSVSLSVPAGGAVVDNGDGTVTYTPNADFFGSDSFTYTVDDNNGAASNTATVTVTVNPVNDVPVISGSPATTVAEDSAYTFTPTASDVDPNTTLTFSATNLPAWASLDTATGAVTGTPTNDDVGSTAGVVISVSDGSESAALAAFTLTVTNTNDDPLLTGTPNTSVDEDSAYGFNPVGSDVDVGDSLTYSASNLPSWASIDPATGAITGTPDNSAVGTYSGIVVSVSDGTSTVNLPSFDLTVNNTNDAPVGALDAYTVDEGGVLQRDALQGVLSNDMDIDGDTITAELVSGPAFASAFNLNADGSFTYSHDGEEVDADQFTYRITDGTVTTDAISVNLTVTAVNDVPEFVSDPDLSVLEGQAYSYSVGVTDPDSVVTLTLQQAPEWLTLSGNQLTGTAPLNEVGAVQVVLRAADGEYTVDQTFNLDVVEQESSVLTLSQTWQGLPSLVGSTVDLFITVTHNKGPAVANGVMQITLQGAAVTATMANCTRNGSLFNCPINTSEGTNNRYRLRVTPTAAGNLVVNAVVDNANASTLVQGITDLSISPKAVSQGNTAFSLAKATAIASINLQNDGTKELVAGTSLGETVKLLDYQVATATATILGEIENRGETKQVIVKDVDMDSLDDILVVNSGGDATAVYYDRGDQFVAEPGSLTLPHAKQGLLRDLDDDGFPELILGGNGFSLYIYPNNAGVFSQQPLVFTTPASVVHFGLLGRLPTDSSFEGTLVISSQNVVMLVRFGLGAGTTKPGDENSGQSVSQEKITLLQQLPISGVSSLQLTDVDGDGREEIIASVEHQNFTSSDSGVAVIRVGDSNELTTVARLGAASAKRVDVADFNGDGDADLLVANDNGSYQIYHGQQDPSTWALSDTVVYKSSSLVIPEDANGDGLADILVYEENNEQVELYLSAPIELGEDTDLLLSAANQVVSNSQVQFTHTLSVQNSGDVDVENARIVLPLPANVSVASLPDACVEDTEVHEVYCTVDTIPAGDDWSVPITLSSDASVSQTSLTASVVSDAFENDQSNNQVSTSLSGMFDTSSARVKGGGSLDWGWLFMLGLLLLVPGKRLANSSWQSKPNQYTKTAKTIVGTLMLAVFTLSSTITQADSNTSRAYGQLSILAVGGEWDAPEFYSDAQNAVQDSAVTEKEDTRIGISLLGGYAFTKHIAIEGGYIDSGETELAVDVLYSDADALVELLEQHAPASGQGPYLGARFSWVGEGQEQIYLKTGVWAWSADYTITWDEGSRKVSKDEADLLIGIGFSMPVTDEINLGGHFETVVLDDQQLMMFGLDVQYRFGF